MQRWNALSEVPADVGRCAVTIGNFDGVHRGHRRVLADLVTLARRHGASAVAITFDPHPVAVLRPESAPPAIDGLQARLDRLDSTGLDAVLVLPFTREFATWSPRRFVEDVLVGALHAAVVVVGRDTRFGHRNSGDVGTLRELGGELGFEVVTVDEETDTGGGRYSSTAIRDLLAAGDVRTAAAALGHLHRVTGTVVHGDHRGRGLGFPTANLGPDAQGMVPADGVYAGWLSVVPDGPAGDGAALGGHRMPAAVSVGTNPTFDGAERRVEAYVLDRDDLDLYHRSVVVEFVERLRPTERYDGVEALVAQMHRDVEATRSVLVG